MFIFLNILVLIFIASALAFYYFKKKAQLRKEMLPGQIRLVRELVDVLASYKIGITLVSKPDHFLEQYKRAGELSLTGIGNCLDNNNELSLEKYDDHAIFIKGTGWMSGLESYLTDPLTPAKIKYELSPFSRGQVQYVSTASSPSVILNMVLAGNTAEHELHSEVLCQSREEAFDSWLLFKENMHSLHFVINQWLEENAHAMDFQLSKKI